MDNALCRVLLVEDNEDDYIIVRDLLSDVATTQFDLHWVNAYGAARESLFHESFDVCLFDYRLGESNGVELVREFGDIGTPFILLTGNEDFEVDVAATKAGTADYLIKGHINAPLLERSIRYAIERKKTENTLRRMQEELEERVLERTRELGEINDLLRVENVQHQITMGTLRQVAEAYREAKEEADIANAAKSEFLSRMSHELRTPLNAILGFGQILESEDHDIRTREHIGHILRGGQHLLDLINEVLDITRVEAGKLELALESISLSEIVPDACALLRPLAAQRGIHLYENTAERDQHFALADRQRLRQILINLLANAIKYNRDGGQVHITCLHPSEGWVSIAVRDTGRGISPQDITKLFTPFERLGAASTNIEGTGLGLVLSRRLATAMGGNLLVESIQGRGTTFTIELPMAPSPEELAKSLVESAANPEAKREVERIYTVLCIEDTISNLKLMEAIFEKRQQIVMMAATQGSIGLELAYQHKPDLILLDLNLPDMQAPEILSYLQHSTSTAQIPVIIISADATQTQIDRLLQAGAQDYLTKPFNIVQFLQTIDSYLIPK